MPLDIKVEPENFQIKGKVPDKILYIILAIITITLGISGEELLGVLQSVS
jgi:hypothetical protein